MAELERFNCLVELDTSIGDAISMMNSSPANKNIAGIVVVVDGKKKVLGVMTDGDVRRALASGISLSDPLSKIANQNPLTVKRHLNPALMRRAVMDEARRRNSNYFKYDRLVLVEDDGSFYDVIRLSDIMDVHIDEKTIAVYGLGFVGLTLACTLANAGLSVVGIDTDKSRVEGLKRGVAPFYEKGLDSMLSSLASTNPIDYTADGSERSADIHIVTVGSPIGADNKPDLSFIKAASKTIASRLKQENLVVFRSTVPVGTMRHVVMPILEESGLRCGQDFYLAFAPERTVEGNALEELRLLPQVVGGFNPASAALTVKLFRHITNTIIEVKSLEEAELVKLMNNTFRDLVFSFSNEVASICEGFNINAFDIIRAANEGYPRNPIPMPSPGVGGICLSKDPYLYTQPIAELKNPPVLGQASRSINRMGADYVLGKLERFAARVKKPVKDMKILIVGLAFKGMPETSDIRASVATDLVGLLPNPKNIRVKDFVVSDEDVRKLGCTPVKEELDQALNDVDAVLVMNNHYRNNKFNVVEALKAQKKQVLFFDGWNMFNRREIESLGHISYATMGYMTPAGDE